MLELVSGIFDLSISMMRKIALFFSIISLFSCNTEPNFDNQVFEALQKLEAGKMIVDIEIGGEQFYPLDLPFQGTISVNDQACFVNLKNPEGGNVVVSIEEENWYKADLKKINFKEALPTEGNLYGSFLIGRRDDTKGEGYLLKEGNFELVQLNQEACIITVHGILKNPFNDEVNKPINGYIVWKKPPALNPETLGSYFFN
ncbi:hypothetical protein [Jiulongibacter sp. NS-SX5]|uniref:hypothetical protein n=1 Tax=Jiulongibacter sp. NS-SX5 TaxID=3463854 RepID=UPI004059BEB0